MFLELSQMGGPIKYHFCLDHSPPLAPLRTRWSSVVARVHTTSLLSLWQQLGCVYSALGYSRVQVLPHHLLSNFPHPPLEQATPQRISGRELVIQRPVPQIASIRPNKAVISTAVATSTERCIDNSLAHRLVRKSSQ